MTGRGVLADAAAELFADLTRVLRTVDPIPPHVYEQARRAHQHRQGAPVALPGQTPGGVAAPRLDHPPRSPDGGRDVCRGGCGVPSAAQTAGPGARSRGTGNPPHEVTQDPGPAPTR